MTTLRTFHHFIARGSDVIDGDTGLVVGSTGGGAGTDWAAIPLGAGGWVTGLDMQGDERLGRTDTYGLYRWDSTGSVWQQLLSEASVPAGDVGPGIGIGVYEARIAPSNTNRYYMSFLSSVYRSDDKGTTWTKTALTGKTFEPNDGLRYHGAKMAVDPANADVCYAGFPNDGVYRTTDAGATWTKMGTISAAGEMYAVVIDTSGGTQGAGSTLRHKNVWVVAYGVGTYRSTDGGGTWAASSGGPVKVSRLVSGGDGYIYCSSDDTSKYLQRWNGTSWSAIVTDANLAPHSVAVNPNNTSHIIAFRSGSVPTHSTDRGATWGNTNWNPTLNSTTIPWIGWASEGSSLADGEVRFDPNVAGRIWIGYGLGVAYADVTSSDNAITWNDMSQGIEQLVVNVIKRKPGGPLILGAWDRPTWVLDDLTPGAYVDRYYPDNGFGATWDLSIANDGTIVAANTNLLNTAVTTAARSTNNTTWTTFADDPGNYGNIAVKPTDASKVVWIPSFGLPSYSSNGGDSWTTATVAGVASVNSGAFFCAANYLQRRILTVDAAGNFYAMYSAPDANAGGVFRSTDNGANWTRQCTEPVSNADPLWGVLHWGGFNSTLMAAPGQTGDLWMCAGPQDAIPDTENTGMKLVRSTDGGATWSAISNVTEPHHIGFGKAAPGETYPTIYMVGYVGHVYGIWRSTDTGASWTNIGTYPAGNVSLANYINGDPDRYGWVYVALGGAGAVWRDASAI